MGALARNVDDWARRYQAAQRSTCPHPKRIYDYASAGIDEYTQGILSDPSGSVNGMALRVPGLSTVASAKEAELSSAVFDRYLFALCSVQIGHARRRLVGLGQYATIGYLITKDVEDQSKSRSIECQVITPSFRFDSGNLSWHLTVHSEINRPIGALNADSFSYLFAPMSLVYQAATFNAANLNVYGRPDYYTTLTSYTPPNNGFPYGSALIPALGTFYDIRFPWNYGDCLGNMDFEVEGPCTVTFWCSVCQRDTSNEIRATSPNDDPLETGWGGPEETFLQNFPDAIYWRVGGRMIWEDAECSEGTCSGNSDSARFYGGLRVIDGGRGGGAREGGSL